MLQQSPPAGCRRRGQREAFLKTLNLRRAAPPPLETALKKESELFLADERPAAAPQPRSHDCHGIKGNLHPRPAPQNVGGRFIPLTIKVRKETQAAHARAVIHTHAAQNTHRLIRDQRRGVFWHTNGNGSSRPAEAGEHR